MSTNIITSTPSVADCAVLFNRWRDLPGNEYRNYSDFYDFLSVESVDRDVFLKDFTVVSYFHMGALVAIKLLPV